MPFKLLESNPDGKNPMVTGADSLTSILCFNEEYVNQFVFQKEELLSNSFDVLFRNADYVELPEKVAIVGFTS
jgi:hypothetical protein